MIPEPININVPRKNAAESLDVKCESIIAEINQKIVDASNEGDWSVLIPQGNHRKELWNRALEIFIEHGYTVGKQDDPVMISWKEV